MRKILYITLMLCASAASAVNVQVGFSSYNHRIADAIEDGSCQSHSSPWQSVTTTITGIGGGSRFENAWLCERFISTSSSGPTGVSVEWVDRNNPKRVRLISEGDSGYYIDIDVGDVVKCPTFGRYMPPYIDRRLEYGVFTIRGDPYSVVMNDTNRDRVVNGVMIKAGEAAKLPFPFWLRMEEVKDIRFFDLATGDEFQGRDFGGNVYYQDGAYAPMWTGDFRFTDGTKKVLTNINQLVFADLKTESSKLLFGTNNMPVYAGLVNISTNIQLNTWWDFDRADWGVSPKAIINGEVVCESHSTTHIIAYTVNANNLNVSAVSGIGVCYFTMSQIPQSGYSGGSCVMRCWDAKMGSDAAGYANTPAKHKAEVTAGMSAARFKLTINIYTGEWKVEPN